MEALMLNKSIIKDFYINLLLHSKVFFLTSLDINNNSEAAKDTVISWTDGTGKPTMEQIEKIANFFNVEVIELFKSTPCDLKIIKESLNSINAKLEQIIKKF
jgi:hypothetical protein